MPTAWERHEEHHDLSSSSERSEEVIHGQGTIGSFLQRVRLLSHVGPGSTIRPKDLHDVHLFVLHWRGLLQVT